ncbi:MAG: hypothetical protein K5790_10415 [Nitrosopumilus sp.]|uniref:hypothetical protein n=1 Tax=Nitrosopumilus sp. TaxID=2024843 RepID=UPI00247DC5F5|nr:hypothetical protein [Nitrosopumilus sp.]MCV0393683.1 hypothetical protein [Nitrosopumilus sp.]
MDGHKEKGVFHPHDNESKKISSDSINTSTDVDTTSTRGEKELEKTKVEKSIGSLTLETKQNAEAKVGSEIIKHVYGNVYEFKNGEEWLILNNRTQAHKEAIEYLDNVWDEMGILGWNKSFIESFVDEGTLERRLGITYDDIYNRDSPNFQLAKQVPLNKKELFNESIKHDGIAHSLASYDHEEVELPQGKLMYRVN